MTLSEMKGQKDYEDFGHWSCLICWKKSGRKSEKYKEWEESDSF